MSYLFFGLAWTCFMAGFGLWFSQVARIITALIHKMSFQTIFWPSYVLLIASGWWFLAGMAAQ